MCLGVREQKLRCEKNRLSPWVSIGTYYNNRLLVFRGRGLLTSIISSGESSHGLGFAVGRHESPHVRRWTQASKLLPIAYSLNNKILYAYRQVLGGCGPACRIEQNYGDSLSRENLFSESQNACTQ